VVKKPHKAISFSSQPILIGAAIAVVVSGGDVGGGGRSGDGVIVGGGIMVSIGEEDS
jgi:hypothetical protein